MYFLFVIYLLWFFLTSAMHHWSFSYWFVVLYILRKPARCDYNYSFSVCLLILFMVFYFCLTEIHIFGFISLLWLLGLGLYCLQIINFIFHFSAYSFIFILKSLLHLECIFCKGWSGSFCPRITDNKCASFSTLTWNAPLIIFSISICIWVSGSSFIPLIYLNSEWPELCYFNITVGPVLPHNFFKSFFTTWIIPELLFFPPNVNNQHLFSIFYIPGTILRDLCILMCLILLTGLPGR